jgi:hypothetical protein
MSLAGKWEFSGFMRKTISGQDAGGKGRPAPLLCLSPNGAT